MLSGYMPNADVVKAVGEIGKSMKKRVDDKASSFFWGECTLSFLMLKDVHDGDVLRILFIYLFVALIDNLH